MTTSTTTSRKPRKNRFEVKRGVVPPSSLVLHFSPDQWEKFIEEACRQRTSPNGALYSVVKQLGGAGDGGRDIEARLVTALSEGQWDLYQAKHYSTRLSPSEFFPELAKFFLQLVAGTYPPPRNYLLCAPRGVGNDLHNLLSKPVEFKARFLRDWMAGKTGLQGRSDELTKPVQDLVAAYDFSKIIECQLRDLLAWHELNRKEHFELFGIEAERGDDPSAPDIPTMVELAYIEELRRLYEEHAGRPITLQQVLQEQSYNEHLQGHRALFYCAEGLKMFSRDLYGEDEFNTLLEMVLIGVRSSVNSLKHKTGEERLGAGIYMATSLKINDSVLAPRLRAGDLPGTCHHLANEGKLKWVK
ncbi:ABC-three component system protein [Parapusillimonas sp. JC17]|uniref:ABC-three component system protein n=1 Tax=Parapusillimonas sp. JC17 TaxID=3445768 RepID=UPI003FA0CDC2